MKNFFKNLKAGMIFSGVFSLALGIILILIPGIIETALRFILGGGLCLFGLLEIVFVFVRPNGLLSVGRMIPGILCLAVGLVFIFRFETFFSLLWMLMGVAVLIDSVYKLQYAFELKAGNVGSWWVNLLTSICALIFAVVLIITPYSDARPMAILAGILLTVNGLFDLISAGFMSANAKKLKSLSTVEIRDALEEDTTKAVENA
ncbi:MAG: DUF308 domain-containing protein [Clostridia bacterium]|nr:DUF308 domain-containing protein [Clostridia bacterium]